MCTLDQDDDDCAGNHHGDDPYGDNDNVDAYDWKAEDIDDRVRDRQGVMVARLVIHPDDAEMMPIMTMMLRMMVDGDDVNIDSDSDDVVVVDDDDVMR